MYGNNWQTTDQNSFSNQAYTDKSYDYQQQNGWNQQSGAQQSCHPHQDWNSYSSNSWNHQGQQNQWQNNTSGQSQSWNQNKSYTGTVSDQQSRGWETQTHNQGSHIVPQESYTSDPVYSAHAPVKKFSSGRPAKQIQEIQNQKQSTEKPAYDYNYKKKTEDTASKSQDSNIGTRLEKLDVLNTTKNFGKSRASSKSREKRSSERKRSRSRRRSSDRKRSSSRKRRSSRKRSKSRERRSSRDRKSSRRRSKDRKRSKSKEKSSRDRKTSRRRSTDRKRSKSKERSRKDSRSPKRRKNTPIQQTVKITSGLESSPEPDGRVDNKNIQSSTEITVINSKQKKNFF